MISEFPLFVFTTLGGLGAGFYFACTIWSVEGKRKNVFVAFISLALLVIGGIALMLHLGHPERLLNAFSNPAAGITQEAVVSTLFGACLFLDLVICFFKGKVEKPLRWICSALGIVLSCVMGYAYFSYASMDAWHAFPTIPLFVFGNLAMGFALYAAFEKTRFAHKPLVVSEVVFDVFMVVVCACEAVLFAKLGMTPVPQVMSAIALLIAVAVESVAARREKTGARWLVFIIVCSAVVVARYAFYAAL